MVHVYVCGSKNGVAMLSRHCAPSLFVLSLQVFALRSVYIGGLATIILTCRHCFIVSSSNRELNRNISHFTRGANTDFQLAFKSRAMDNENFFNYRISFICNHIRCHSERAIAYRSRATRFFADAHLSTRFNQIHTSNAYVFEQINVFNDFYQCKITQSMRINESS
jgi:hypothetical protein